MGYLITAYYGSLENMPHAVLCNGQNGTPDLRDKFIKGAANANEIGDIGGGSHTHTVNTAGAHTHDGVVSSGVHTHDLKSDATPKVFSYDSDDASITNEYHNHSSVGSAAAHQHTISTHINKPPFYRLCYIMLMHGFRWDLPVKSIVMFNGSDTEIPEGWAICDGSNGTVDLRNKFIKGYTTKGTTKGSSTHNHASLQHDGGHTHTSQAVSFSHSHGRGEAHGSDEAGLGLFVSSSPTRGTVQQGPSHTHEMGKVADHTHSIGTGSNDPAYYKLLFVQRIS